MLLRVACVLMPLFATAGCAQGGIGGAGTAPPISAPSALSPAGRALTTQVLRRELRIPERYRNRMDQALLTGRLFELSELRDELRTANPVALLDWKASRHLSGWLRASVYYIEDLDRIGAGRDNADLRYASVMVWMYALASYLVDRERCARTDGRVFMEYLMQVPARGTAGFAAALAPERLQQAIHVGIRLEEEVAPERSPRGHFCDYGVDYLANDGAPLLVPAAQAEPRVAAARRDLPRTLPALVGNLLAIFRTRALG